MEAGNMPKPERMPAAIIAAFLLLGSWVLPEATASNGPVGRVKNALIVLKELSSVQEGIPDELLSNCYGLAIFPTVYKAGFIVGGSVGRGLYVRKNPRTRKWEGPLFLSIGGGSFGWQLGIEATDLVIVVMNQRGVDALMHENLSLGGDISIAAGPVGRTFKAATDMTIRSELLSYSRTKGFFAGISLDGTYIHHDYGANETFYGKAYTPTEIMEGRALLQEDGRLLLEYLNSNL